MLINSFKFDLRIYVLVTSVNPLRIYVYDEGLCRLASEKYDMTNTKNIFSHLTNYSINKKNEPGTKISSIFKQENSQGIKWSLKELREHLSSLKDSKVLPMWSDSQINDLFKQIDQIVIKTIISAEPLLQKGVEMFLPNAY